MQMQQFKKRGFAAISPERMREIASAGGFARKRAYDMARGRNKTVQSLPSQTTTPEQSAGTNQTQ